RAGAGAHSLFPRGGEPLFLSRRDPLLASSPHGRRHSLRGPVGNPQRLLSRVLLSRLSDRLARPQESAKDPVRGPVVRGLPAPFSDRADRDASLSWRGELVAVDADHAAADLCLRLALLEFGRAADPEPQGEHSGGARSRLGGDGGHDQAVYTRLGPSAGPIAGGRARGMTLRPPPALSAQILGSIPLSPRDREEDHYITSGARNTRTGHARNRLRRMERSRQDHAHCPAHSGIES